VTDAFIHLADLRKVYPMRGEDFRAVSDLTMEVRRGSSPPARPQGHEAPRRVYAADLYRLGME
jgi:hypothetical protein